MIDEFICSWDNSFGVRKLGETFFFNLSVYTNSRCKKHGLLFYCGFLFNKVSIVVAFQLNTFLTTYLVEHPLGVSPLENRPLFIRLIITIPHLGSEQKLILQLLN